MIFSHMAAAVRWVALLATSGLAAGWPAQAETFFPHPMIFANAQIDDTGNGDTPTAPVPVEDTEQFFHAFVSKHLPPDGDPFTGKSSGAHLPTVWDSGKIVYLTVMPDAQATDVVPSNGGAFYYSLWSQNLTAYGGWKADRSDGGWHPRNTTPIQIRRGIEGLGQHEAALGFGSPVAVVDYSAVDYVLYLHGTDTCPPNVFDKGSCRFVLTTHLRPLDAKALASHMQMVIGVRPRSYSASYFGMIHQHDATAQAHVQSTEYRASIEADFEKILLLDTSTGQTVAEWDALPPPQKQEIPGVLRRFERQKVEGRKKQTTPRR